MPTFETIDALIDYMATQGEHGRRHAANKLLSTKTRPEIEAWLKDHESIEIEMRERLNEIKNKRWMRG